MKCVMILMNNTPRNRNSDTDQCYAHRHRVHALDSSERSGERRATGDRDTGARGHSGHFGQQRVLPRARIPARPHQRVHAQLSGNESCIFPSNQGRSNI